MVTEEAEPPVAPQGVWPVVISARVFLAQHQADLNRQVSRLKDDGATHGSHVGRMVTERGSGVNGSRRTLLARLSEPQIDPIVVAHQDRATWFGFRY
jgi:predicted site-specific integrase-resolvase